MATLIKIKEQTKARLKRFAVKRFGDDVGNATTFDAIVSVLLKEAEARPFDFKKLAKLIERGVSK